MQVRFAAIATAIGLGAIVLTGLAAAQAPNAKPRVPPHRDPGGVAIALFGTGIDYTLPAIAPKLARDGEGELIAWDFNEGGRHPYDRNRGGAPAGAGGDATAIASLILAEGSEARLVAVRIAPANPASIAQAVGFVAQTPARVVVVPMWSADEAYWRHFRDAAMRFKTILFIAAAGEGADPAKLYPAAFGLDNVLAVTAGDASADSKGFGGAARKVTGGPLAAALSARNAAALLKREPGLGVADLKRRIVESEGTPK
jgi:hypothetical protein